jgi:hypothetical protein
MELRVINDVEDFGSLDLKTLNHPMDVVGQLKLSIERRCVQ